MPCEVCCTPDALGNYDPCCAESGMCEHEENVNICKCCGCMMFEENGLWYCEEQRDIPIEDRKPHL